MAVDELEQHKKTSMLETFSKIGNITRSAQVVGVSRGMHYHWLEHDEEYLKGYQDALETFKDSLAFEGFRRGMIGIDEPVVYQGQISVQRNDKGQPIIDSQTQRPIPVTTKRYSDTMLIVTMKRMGVFVERQEYSGPEGGAIPVIFSIPDNQRDTKPTPITHTPIALPDNERGDGDGSDGS